MFSAAEKLLLLLHADDLQDFFDRRISSQQDGGRRDQERLHMQLAQAGEGPGGAVGVQGGEDQVTGEGGFDGDVRGLFVAGLPDQDDIRVLAQEGAQHAGEIEADVFVYLDLVDAGKVVFDRVFRGGDVNARVVDLSQRGIERSRLARARRPGYIKDAVGLVDEFAHQLERGLVADDFIEPKRGVRFIEDAHADLLAPLAGHGRDAKVYGLAFHVDADAAILGQALFRNNELAQNLQARDQTELHFFGQVLHRLQHTINAVADDHVGFHGLNVDVARTLLDGQPEN